MRILVLGATGFIGHNLAEYFARLGHEVVAVDHIKPRYDFDGIKWLFADLRQPIKLDSYDVVIQAAATTSGSKDIVNNPVQHVSDNAIMNSLIFRAAAEAKVKHVIFFSCTVMYPNGVCSEETPIGIHPKYFGVAHTKLYCEKLCEFYAGETKFTAIRHSNIYGPYDKFDLERSHVFGATIAKVMQAEDKVVVWGTGEEARDFLHVDDLCNFVDLAINKQKDKFKLYNCGYGHAFSVDSLVHDVIEASGKNLAIEYDTSKPTIPTSLSLDCSKAKAELGWEPHVSLGTGIKRTIEWYKNVYSA